MHYEPLKLRHLSGDSCEEQSSLTLRVSRVYVGLPFKEYSAHWGESPNYRLVHKCQHKGCEFTLAAALVHLSSFFEKRLDVLGRARTSRCMQGSILVLG